MAGKPKTIREIRMANLLKLVEENDNSKTAVARLADTNAYYLVALISSPCAQHRGIGNALARKLETGCKKPEGWMDIEHPLDPRQAEIAAIFSKLSQKNRDELLQKARMMVKKK